MRTAKKPFEVQSGRWIVAAALLLAGCSKGEVQVYEIPKEADDPPPPHLAETEPERPELPPGHPALAGNGDRQEMADRQLPRGARIEAAVPEWEAPGTWSPGPESEMRRGSFHVHSDDGARLDIAITVFPGDVGGPLANVNRWRAQVGLPPVDEGALADHIKHLEIDGRTAWMVELVGPEQTTVAATVENEGNSWFVRMTGDSDLAVREMPHFRAFLRSIRFN